MGGTDVAPPTLEDVTGAADTSETPADNGVATDTGGPNQDVALPEDTAPVNIVTGPPATCFQAYVCASECAKNDAGCIDKCNQGGSVDVKAQLDAVLACQKAKCAAGTLDACATDETKCWDDFKSCAYDGAAGMDTCKVAFTCTRDCKGGEWGCIADCFGKVNAEQQHDLVTYVLCVKSYCGLDATDQCLLEANGLGGCGTAAGFCSG